MQIPTLLTFVIPPSIGQDFFKNLGSPDKELLFFERSHHSPMATETAFFNEKVKDFIEKHK